MNDKFVNLYKLYREYISEGTNPHLFHILLRGDEFVRSEIFYRRQRGKKDR